MRMFFNDHDPPHFHVLARRNTSETLATFHIGTLDLLSGSLNSAVRTRVEAWAEARKKDLTSNWERCRRGQRPLLATE